IDAITFSLSLTVGSVELPIAACSGFHASLRRRSNALLWFRSTRAACSSVLISEMVSSYNCLNDGVILPILNDSYYQSNSITPPAFLIYRTADFGVLTY